MVLWGGSFASNIRSEPRRLRSDPDDTVQRVRGLYEYRRRRFEARADGDGSDGIEERSAAYQRLQRELFNARRDELTRLRRNREISDDVMRKVQHGIDLEDTRLEI